MKTQTIAPNILNDFSSGKKTADSPNNETSRQVNYKAVSEHLCCELNGEAVILSLKNGKYYGLNPVGARIWELIQDPLPAARIERKILSEYEVEEEVCRREIADFLTLMQKEELVEIVNEPVTEIRKTAAGGKDTIY